MTRDWRGGLDGESEEAEEEEREGWAKVSLSVMDEGRSAAELVDRLPQSFPGRGPRAIAIVDFGTAEPDRILQAQLDALSDYLHDHRAELLRLRDSSANLEVRVGWTPRYPQECLVVPAPLIRSLAELNLDIMLDSYPS